MVTNRTFPPCSVKLQESLKALLYSSKFVVQSAMLSQTLISAWNYTLYIFFFFLKAILTLITELVVHRIVIRTR